MSFSFLRQFKTGIFLLFFMVLLDTSVFAGGLRFSPQRILIEGRQRNATLTLTNASKEPASYRITFVDILYQDDGSVIEAEQIPKDYPTARKLLRFSPSQVRLAAGETQTIRVLVRGRNIPAGEYRVHAKLSKIPDVSTVKDPVEENSKNISVSVSVNQAISLPVILRRGETSAKASIQSVSLETNKKQKYAVLDIKLAREGNRSLYTDLVVRDTAGKKIKEVKGIALPVPNPWRRYSLHINDLTPTQLKSGKYSLELLNRDANGAVLDSQIIIL